MKFARFKTDQSDVSKHAILKNNILYEITGNLFEQYSETGNTYPIDQVQLLAPLVPRSIIGVGKNYVAKGEAKPTALPNIPVFFYKPTTSVIGTMDEIAIPSLVEQVKFEAELAVIIGKTARNISQEEALDYVFGYTVANDVTAPQLFHPDGHWMLGKSCDTFTPLGPFIETQLDLDNITIKGIHNQEVKQNSSLELIILNIPFLLSYLSQMMSLQPGDVLLSGSPAGADFMSCKDTIECVIEGIGSLKNTVVSAK